MLPPDIETHDALAHLTVAPDAASGSLSRRRFLQAVGIGLGGALAGPQALAALVPGWEEHLASATPIGPHDGVLVVVLMGGGNDGLNMVAPAGDGAYHDRRGPLAIPEGVALEVQPGLGLHPALGYVKERYDEGQVAVVQGVGHPSPDLSHFTSMAAWMHAWGPGGIPSSGWLGRWLDGHHAQADPFRGVSIGSGVPLHLAGVATRATAVSASSPGLGAGGDANDDRMYEVLRQLGSGPTGAGPWGDLAASTAVALLDTSAAIAPAFTPALPDGRLVRELTLAARLVNADLGTRVIGVSYGDFDSHADQPSMHGARMAELDAGLRAFFSTLAPDFAGRTTVLTFSEFGRTLRRNGSNGTDHGTASSLLLVGAGVNGGIHGEPPSLTQLTAGDQLVATGDFRSVFASVLERWLDAPATELLGAPFAPYDLFATTPGAVTPPPPPPVVGPAPASLVPLVPSRILDTRDGTGGVMAPVVAGSPRAVQVTGQGGVPLEGVTAAVLNVTVTEPTRFGWLSVHPSGEEPPLASNVNFRAGQTVPNLVVAKLGGDGRVVLTNGHGSAQVVVDVMGYLSPQMGSALLPLSPARLLDTRDGTGRAGSLRPLGRGGRHDLVVLGRGGVPAAGVDAVVLNVTATEPTVGGYLTVWPSGHPQPHASNLNFDGGDTVANLVVAKVGDDGRVSIANAWGTTHVVADVVGCFVGGGVGSRHVALTPNRILDTRDGTGRAGAGHLSSMEVIDLAVAGRGGVPSEGVEAVVFNLTVAEPSGWGYVTVFPRGQAPPLASNLNFDAGDTRANLVVAKVGDGGEVSILNASPGCHLVADVAGYFTVA